MANNTVKVVARITAQPDKIEEVESLLLGLVGDTRKESGCISYQLLQNKADPSDFTFVEEWESDSAIDTHFITPHMRNAFLRAPPLLVEEPDIRRYLVISSAES